jgi:hypothetical protein
MLVALAGSLGTAQAARVWCKSDPIVRLNGVYVQMLVGIPQEYQSAVNGAVSVTVYTPSAGVSKEITFVDSGFNGYGESVKVVSDSTLKVAKDGSFPVRIVATVPVNATKLKALGATTLPIQLESFYSKQLGTDASGKPAVVYGRYAVATGNGSATLRLTLQP